MPFCWCADGDEGTSLSLVVIGATERAGATSFIEQQINNGSIEGVAQRSRHPAKDPIPTIEDLERYRCTFGMSSSDHHVTFVDVGRRIRSEVTGRWANGGYAAEFTTEAGGTEPSLGSTVGGSSWMSLSADTARRFNDASEGRRKRSVETGYEFMKALQKCDGIVIVVDSSDHEPVTVGHSSSASSSRRQVSRQQVKLFWEVRRFLAEMVEGRGVKVVKGRKRLTRDKHPLYVVAANKQDIPGALDASDVEASLGLDLSQRAAWICLPCVANNAEFRCRNLIDGFILFGTMQRALALQSRKANNVQHGRAEREKRLYKSLPGSEAPRQAEESDVRRRPSSGKSLDATLFSPSAAYTVITTDEPIAAHDIDILMEAQRDADETVRSKGWIQPATQFIASVLRRNAAESPPHSSDTQIDVSYEHPVVMMQ